MKSTYLSMLAAMAIGVSGIETGLAQSLVITTSEDAGSFSSTLSGTSVFTFDNLNRGVYSNVDWKDTGTISRVSVLPANQYGGAPTLSQPTGSNYAVQSVNSALGRVPETRLSFHSPSSYFGLYWSAGDYYNTLTFYNGDQRVASFSTSTLMNALPKSYWGNPIEKGPYAGTNRGEPYGFINFYGGEDTQWTSVVMNNSGSSGFESDNWTSRVTAYDPSIDGKLGGTPVAIVQTIDNVQTTSLIQSIDFDGQTVTVTGTDGNTVQLVSAQMTSTDPDPNSPQNQDISGGSQGTQLAGWKLHGVTTGINNPEPSVLLTFGLGAVLVVLVRRRKQATA